MLPKDLFSNGVPWLKELMLDEALPGQIGDTVLLRARELTIPSDVEQTLLSDKK